MSVVVSGDFFRFRLALPSLLILSKDEVKATHSDFDRCPCGGGLRTENPPDRHFSQPYLRSLHSGTCLNAKTPRAFRWKRAFCTWISKFASFWLCFEQADWTQPRKKLGYEVNFLSTASGTVEQCTILAPSPQRHQACFFDLTDFSTVFLGFYGVNFLCSGGNRINIYGVSTDKARRKYVHNFRGNSQFWFLTRITLIYE